MGSLFCTFSGLKTKLTEEDALMRATHVAWSMKKANARKPTTKPRGQRNPIMRKVGNSESDEWAVQASRQNMES